MKMLYIFPFLEKFPQYLVLTISKYGLESTGLHMESIWNTKGTDKTSVQNLLRIWSDLDLVRSDQIWSSGQNWSEFDQKNWL